VDAISNVGAEGRISCFFFARMKLYPATFSILGFFWTLVMVSLVARL
jgi:hypothetical protein